jgi:hypothetical protein
MSTGLKELKNLEIVVYKLLKEIMTEDLCKIQNIKIYKYAGKHHVKRLLLLFHIKEFLHKALFKSLNNILESTNPWEKFLQTFKEKLENHDNLEKLFRIVKTIINHVNDTFICGAIMSVDGHFF